MLWKRRRSDVDFKEEIQSHIEIEKERLIGEGMTPDEARSAAYRLFGNVTASQERFYESKRSVFWDSMKQDLKYAFRMFGRQPRFVLIVILTLALGIGSTTAILSLLDTVLLRPLP